VTNLVETSGLSKRFDAIVAVDSVTFSVARGEVLGFLGPNGAGKSTTMKMITGFLAPDAGEIRVGGDALSRDPVSVKRRIGYLPEGAPLYADMTPAQFLEFTGRIRGLSAQALQERVRDTVAKVNLETVLYRPIEILSKGFKRRVGIAQAILHDPEVLVLDEPTDGLDPNQKFEMRSLIRDMGKDKAIILSTHILEEVDAVCTRAIIISAGKIVADGTPMELESRAESHNAVRLQLAHGHAIDVAHELKHLSDVARVESIPDPAGSTGVHYVIYPQKGRSIIDGISALARENKWPVQQIRVDRGRLDEVFRNVTKSVQEAS